MTRKKDTLIYEDGTFAIRGAIFDVYFDVYKEMSNGFLESVYQECLERELTPRRYLLLHSLS